MKIAHISDIHLNINATRLGKLKLDSEGKNPVYLNRLGIFKWCIKTALEKRVDQIIITGDIFDKPKPFPQEYSDLYEILKRYKDITYLLYGNHDEMTTKGSGLQPIKDMGFNVALERTTWDKNIYLNPWGLKIDKLQTENCLLALHAGVRDTNHQWVEVDGEEGNYTLDDLQRLNCRGIMLGHHHNQCEIAPDIWYAGSPECFNFGEENDKKGFLIWDVSHETIDVEQISTHHLFPAYKTLTPEEFLNYPDKGIDAYLRVKGEVTEKDRLDIVTKLRSFDCLDYKLELTSKMKNKQVKKLQGHSDKEILENYLISKNIENREEIIKLDQEIEL